MIIDDLILNIIISPKYTSPLGKSDPQTITEFELLLHAEITFIKAVIFWEGRV
jgi:hypothetical protein